MENFNNFGELRNHFKEKTIDAEIDAEDREKEEKKEKFNELLKGKMHKLNGSFPSVIDGVDYINITNGPIEEKTGDVSVLYANVYYENRENKQYCRTFNLFNDGIMQDEKIPEALKINSKYDIYDEILRLADTINLDFYKNVDDKLLPPDKIISTIPETPKIPGSPNTPALTDPKRLEFLENQPNIITGFSGVNSAFRGYYGFVFPKFLMLENEKVGQGAFFRSFEDPIEIDDNRFKLPPDQRITQSEFNNIMQNRWKPLANLTKTEFVNIGGGDRKIHPHMNDSKWEEKMQMEIDRRS